MIRRAFLKALAVLPFLSALVHHAAPASECSFRFRMAWKDGAEFTQKLLCSRHPLLKHLTCTHVSMQSEVELGGEYDGYGNRPIISRTALITAHYQEL